MLRTLLCSCFIWLCLSSAYAAHTDVTLWKDARIYHAPLDAALDKVFPIERMKCKANVQGAVFSSNKAYWVKLINSSNDNSNFQLEVYNEKGCATVSLERLYSNFSPPTVNWINEKLIYVQVWWGRIKGAYFILDVEQSRIIAAEEVRDGTLEFQQFQASCSKNPSLAACAKH